MPVADVAPTLEAMRETMTVLQKYYASPSFVALQELLIGARTDKTLKDVMEPLEVALDQKISESIIKRFPVWAHMPETSEVLRDLLARVGMSEFERAYAAARENEASQHRQAGAA